MTSWYATLLLVTVLLLGGGIYLGLRTVLYDNFAEQVRQDAELSLGNVTSQGSTLSFDPAKLPVDEDGEQFVRVVAADGTVVADTSAESEIPASSLPGFDPQARETVFQTVQTEQGAYGVATVPVLDGSRALGMVQVGVARNDVDQTLHSIALAFAVATPILLGIALAGGYLLSGRALAPVVAISTMAASIQADDLGARLQLDLPDDELGQLARTFDAMLARIETAFARQRQFTGDAAHELRTPLSLMRGQVDLTLSRARSPDEYQQALANIRGDIERLTVVVSTLLALARADSGNLRLAREPTDLGAIVPRVLASYASQAADLRIVLLDQSAPVVAEVDQDLIVQLLVNLIDNALAHTPPGGMVSAGAAERSGSACLWVDDSGIGIGPEHQQRIFDRFYRVDVGRSRAQGGAGLGLALCKTIVDAHGGVLTVASTPGVGTRFECCLPFVAGSPGDRGGAAGRAA